MHNLNPFRRINWSTLVATHRQQHPGDVAIHHEGREVSWSELDDRAGRLAAWLRSSPVGTGERVAVLTLNIPEFVEAMVAAARIGAIAVPLNFRLSTAELDEILTDCTPLVLIVQDKLVSLLPPSVYGRTRILVVDEAPSNDEGTTPYQAALASVEPDSTWDDVDDSATGFIMYTSGTTGRPKGAMLSHLNMFVQGVTTAHALDIRDRNDVVLVATPLFHIAALANIAPAMITGATILLYPVAAFNSTELLDSLERHQVTHVFLVPAQWLAVVNDPSSRQRRLAVRVTAWGAASATPTLLRQMAAVFPTAHVVAVFGQTEMSPVTCVLNGEDALRKVGSVGQPVSYVQVRVVDPDMNDVASGEVGEIVYRGPNMFSGYWNLASATEDAFAGGWFHSGDLVRRDPDGFVYVVDRLKDMIISGGENIYCAEVENALAAHPNVRDVAVVGRRDDRWGEVPIAFVVPHDESAPLDATELRPWLSDRLAKYKHPHEIRNVASLPRNASGKVQKHALRALT